MFSENELQTVFDDLKIPLKRQDIEYLKLRSKIKWRFKKGTRVCLCSNHIFKN